MAPTTPGNGSVQLRSGSTPPRQLDSWTDSQIPDFQIPASTHTPARHVHFLRPMMPAPTYRHSKNELFNSTGFAGAAARFWKRSYASDYVGLAVLITGYILIQFLAEPFHRMFFLDNLAIGYPHAEIERVPVCTYMWLGSWCDSLTYNSMAVHLRWRSPPGHPGSMVAHCPSRSAQGARYDSRLVHQHATHALHHGRHQECSGETTTRSHRTMQASTRNASTRPGHI